MQYKYPTIRIRNFIIIPDNDEERQEIALMKAVEKQPVAAAAMVMDHEISGYKNV